MPRALRVWFPGAVYHVIQRGNNEQDIFVDDSDCTWFLKILEEVSKKMLFKIYLYALMRNHYHITIETSDNSISDIMHFINSVYAMRFNKKYQRTGHLFQGRFRSILVDKDNYLLELSRYIHNNPVKAGLVNKPEYYKWSSYGAYVRKEKDDIVATELILSQFRNNFKEETKCYADFVNDNKGTLEEDWLKNNTKRQRFLGNKYFVNKVVREKGAGTFLR